MKSSICGLTGKQSVTHTRRKLPLCHSVWPVWQPCCSSRSAVDAPPSCGPCASSSTGWRKPAGHCCAPSSARCDAYTVWHFHPQLGWTQQPTVHMCTQSSQDTDSWKNVRVKQKYKLEPLCFQSPYLLSFQYIYMSLLTSWTVALSWVIDKSMSWSGNN